MENVKNNGRMKSWNDKIKVWCIQNDRNVKNANLEDAKK